VLAVAAATPILARGARAGDFLEDARTARSVTIRAPRADLARLLSLVTAASGLMLEAAPALAPEPLVAYVPRRPLRETMVALADLFDGQWTAAGAGYRLDPDPAVGRKAAEARETYLRTLQKPLDDQAAEALRGQKAGTLPPVGSGEQRQQFLFLLWALLSPADRRNVLTGRTVTFAVPEEASRGLYPLALALALKDERPLVGPLLASLDLDDKNDLAFPVLRARATGLRENSVIGAIHSTDLWRRDAPMPPEAKPDGPPLPEGVGDMGRINGTRDDQVLFLGEGAGVPVLSRHRAQGGSGPTVVAGGRTLPEVMADLAGGCDATARAGGRGYQLLRSNSEPFDGAGRLPNLKEFLGRRPARGKVVPFAVLSMLGRLTPYQLSILERSNLCSEEARVARELFTVLCFYESLTPPQRAALFSTEGLPAAGLTHRQLHAFLDEKRMRGNLEVHGPLQDMRAIRFRFTEDLAGEEPGITMVVLRDGRPVEQAVTVALPLVEEEETASVTR